METAGITSCSTKCFEQEQSHPRLSPLVLVFSRTHVYQKKAWESTYLSVRERPCPEHVEGEPESTALSIHLAHMSVITLKATPNPMFLFLAMPPPQLSPHYSLRKTLVVV